MISEIPDKEVFKLEVPKSNMIEMIEDDEEDFQVIRKFDSLQ